MEPLTPEERSILRLLWEHGTMKPAQIQDRFPEPIKNNLLRYYLRSLVDKGYATRQKKGKAYHYRASRGREGFVKKNITDLAKAFFGGSKEAVLTHLIKAENLTEDDLLELRRKAIELEKQAGNSSGRSAK